MVEDYVEFYKVQLRALLLLDNIFIYHHMPCLLSVPMYSTLSTTQISTHLVDVVDVVDCIRVGLLEKKISPSRALESSGSMNGLTVLKLWWEN